MSTQNSKENNNENSSNNTNTQNIITTSKTQSQTTVENGENTQPSIDNASLGSSDTDTVVKSQENKMKSSYGRIYNYSKENIKEYKSQSNKTKQKRKTLQINPLDSSVFPISEEKWISGKHAKKCMRCSKSFSRFRCRKCGKVVCGDCSSHKLKSYRVCDVCYEKYKICDPSHELYSAEYWKTVEQVPL